MENTVDRVVREFPEKIKSHPPNDAYREGWDRMFGGKVPLKCSGFYDDNPSVPVEPLPCTGCDEVHCECDEHDPDCEKLCTQGSRCNCGRAGRF